MYVVHTSHPFHPTLQSAGENIETWPAMLAAVDALTGRASVFGFASVRRKLTRGNRCVYIAPARGMRACWVIAQDPRV